MDQPYNLTGVLKTLFQWRKPIIIVTGLVALISVIAVMVVPVYFQAKTIFYAASQDMFKPEKVFGGSSTDMYYYGSREDIDKIQTLSHSKELVDFIVDSFNLFEHYDINPNSSRADYYVRLQFLGLYDVIQTKYDALELTVEDTDPELAANIANAARDKINDLSAGVIKSSQANLVETFRESLDSKAEELSKLQDSLVFYRRKYSIYNSVDQNEYLSGRLTTIKSQLIGMRAKENALVKMPKTLIIRDSLALLQANIEGLNQELLVLNSDTSTSDFSLRRFNIAKGEIEILDEQYNRALSQLSSDRERVKYYKAALDLDVSAIHIIEEAEVPQVKFRPRRSITVLACTFAGFLFSVIGVLLFEANKHINWKEIRSND